MTAIVTLAEAKLFCRITEQENDEDETLLILIDAATDAVRAVADGWDCCGPAPARLKLAVLTHVAQAFDDRETGADLPAPSARLIGPYRVLDV